MLETTAGRLTGRLLQPPRPVSQEVLKSASEDEDMGELSGTSPPHALLMVDSPSSGPSNSRPTTPNQGLVIGRPPTSVDKAQTLAHTRSNSGPNLVPSDSYRMSEDSTPIRRSCDSDGPYGVAHKAERLLGLVPGTLQHARVSLDYARDEVRRLASVPPTQYVAWKGGNGKEHDADDASVHSGSGSEKKGLAGTMRDRARKAMSISLQSNSNQGQREAVPNVVIGVGGAEEELARERRRKVADGVLYWQKQVARLEQEEQEAEMKLGRRNTSRRRTTRKR